jgi:ribonuclease P protein component
VLPKHERLQDKQDFDKIFKQKQSVSTPGIVAYVSIKKDKTDPGLPKVGFIIGKKIHKKAATRNYFKDVCGRLIA